MKSVSLNNLESRSVRSREHGYRNKKLWHKGIKYRPCRSWMSTVVYLAALKWVDRVNLRWRWDGAGRWAGDGLHQETTRNISQLVANRKPVLWSSSRIPIYSTLGLLIFWNSCIARHNQMLNLLFYLVSHTNKCTNYIIYYLKSV
jgi:hypothetical protein